MKYSKVTIYSSVFFMVLAGLSVGSSARAADEMSSDQTPPANNTGSEPNSGTGQHHGGHHPGGGGFYQCQIVDQAGTPTAACASNVNGNVQCYADVVFRSSMQTRIWGNTCVSDAAACLATGMSQVTPCYTAEE